MIALLPTHIKTWTLVQPTANHSLIQKNYERITDMGIARKKLRVSVCSPDVVLVLWFCCPVTLCDFLTIELAVSLITCSDREGTHQYRRRWVVPESLVLQRSPSRRPLTLISQRASSPRRHFSAGAVSHQHPAFLVRFWRDTLINERYKP